MKMESTSPANPTRWRLLRKWWFWLIAAAVGVAVIAALGGWDWEGYTYVIYLVNDTEARLQFLGCSDDECESFYEQRRSFVDSGESVRSGGTVGVLEWWQVRNEADNVLGCFKLDFDERPTFDLYASQLEPCP